MFDKLRRYAVAKIARRAGGDDEDSPDEDEEGLTEEQRAARRRKKQQERAVLKSQLGSSPSVRYRSTKLSCVEHAKMMDLQYFLEMVDRESARSARHCDTLMLTS